MKRVRLVTDGSCLGNPGPGGWAYILRDPHGSESMEAAGEERTTNNRMELTAVIRGLRAAPDAASVLLCADSEYVVKGINEWLAGWKRRGWRKADKKPVVNDDLWADIDAEMQRLTLTATWTRGHAGHAENEACDRMATDQALMVQQMLQG